LLPEKEVLGSKYSTRRSQRAQKSKRVGEAINNSVRLLIIRRGKRVASNCRKRKTWQMDNQDSAFPRL
jgi:hypothetical protein